jgi:hypothetical protein
MRVGYLIDREASWQGLKNRGYSILVNYVSREVGIRIGLCMFFLNDSLHQRVND